MVTIYYYPITKLTERNCSLWMRKIQIKTKSDRKKLVVDRQRKGKGRNVSAPNRWRGGDKQMKIGPAVLA